MRLDGFKVQRKRIVSMQTREKLRLAGLGKSPTPETRARLRASAIARGVPDHILKRLHLSNVGTKRTAATKEKMRLAALSQPPSSARLAITARAKHYTITSPNGVVEQVHSLRRWQKKKMASNVFERQARLKPGIAFARGKWMGWSIVVSEDSRERAND